MQRLLNGKIPRSVPVIASHEGIPNIPEIASIKKAPRALIYEGSGGLLQL